jgi:hypothetical protein
LYECRFSAACLPAWPAPWHDGCGWGHGKHRG